MRSQSTAASGPPSGETSSQVLYVIENGTVSTYSVDKNALTFTSLGPPVNLIPTGSLVQFVPAPHDEFLYVLWSDAANQQHPSVFATDTSGIPQAPALQTVDAPSLYQFNIHRSARFAYMVQVSALNAEYTSTVRLFHVNSADGKLHEDSKLQVKRRSRRRSQHPTQLLRTPLGALRSFLTAHHHVTLVTAMTRSFLSN
jgi:hypothetical protein